MQNTAILILRAIYCSHLSLKQILRKKDKTRRRKVNNLFYVKMAFFNVLTLFQCYFVKTSISCGAEPFSWKSPDVFTQIRPTWYSFAKKEAFKDQTHGSFINFSGYCKNVQTVKERFEWQIGISQKYTPHSD